MNIYHDTAARLRRALDGLLNCRSELRCLIQSGELTAEQMRDMRSHLVASDPLVDGITRLLENLGDGGRDVA